MSSDVTTNTTAELEAEISRLRTENAQLQQALITRVVVEQAKGLVAGAAGVDMATAFELLRTYARAHNHALHPLCREVIHAATGAPTDAGAVRPPRDRSASPVRLSKTPLYADIMACWRDRPRSMQRHRKVPSAWT